MKHFLEHMIMRKLTLTLSAAALALGAGAVAYAQTPERGMRGQEMTRAQAETMATKAFERADANGDGKIDAADREARHDARFARLDINNDGMLSKEEFLASHERRAERTAQGGEQADGKRPGKRGERMGHRGMRGMGHGMGMARNADSDGDGAVSQAEFADAALARFDAADADKNGTVTREERREAHKAMREQMRAQRQTDNS
jgi:Ca2+-binding EF-hand superfamily protein